MLRERFAQIDADNALLLKRIDGIVRHVPAENAQEFAPGVRLAAGQVPRVDHFVSGESTGRGKARFKPTLRGPARALEEERIAEENTAMFHRLTNTRAVYDPMKWEDERRLAEHYLANISEYEVPESSKMDHIMRASTRSGGRASRSSSRARRSSSPSRRSRSPSTRHSGRSPSPRGSVTLELGEHPSELSYLFSDDEQELMRSDSAEHTGTRLPERPKTSSGARGSARSSRRHGRQASRGGRLEAGTTDRPRTAGGFVPPASSEAQPGYQTVQSTPGVVVFHKEVQLAVGGASDSSSDSRDAKEARSRNTTTTAESPVQEKRDVSPGAARARAELLPAHSTRRLGDAAHAELLAPKQKQPATTPVLVTVTWFDDPSRRVVVDTCKPRSPDDSDGSVPAAVTSFELADADVHTLFGGVSAASSSLLMPQHRGVLGEALAGCLYVESMEPTLEVRVAAGDAAAAKRKRELNEWYLNAPVGGAGSSSTATPRPHKPHRSAKTPREKRGRKPLKAAKRGAESPLAVKSKPQPQEKEAPKEVVSPKDPQTFFAPRKPVDTGEAVYAGGHNILVGREGPSTASETASKEADTIHVLLKATWFEDGKHVRLRIDAHNVRTRQRAALSLSDRVLLSAFGGATPESRKMLTRSMRKQLAERVCFAIYALKVQPDLCIMLSSGVGEATDREHKRRVEADLQAGRAPRPRPAAKPKKPPAGTPGAHGELPSRPSTAASSRPGSRPGSGKTSRAQAPPRGPPGAADASRGSDGQRALVRTVRLPIGKVNHAKDAPCVPSVKVEVHWHMNTARRIRVRAVAGKLQVAQKESVLWLSDRVLKATFANWASPPVNVATVPKGPDRKPVSLLNSARMKELAQRIVHNMYVADAGDESGRFTVAMASREVDPPVQERPASPSKRQLRRLESERMAKRIDEMAKPKVATKPARLAELEREEEERREKAARAREAKEAARRRAAKEEEQRKAAAIAEARRAALAEAEAAAREADAAKRAAKAGIHVCTVAVKVPFGSQRCDAAVDVTESSDAAKRLRLRVTCERPPAGMPSELRAELSDAQLRKMFGIAKGMPDPTLAVASGGDTQPAASTAASGAGSPSKLKRSQKKRVSIMDKSRRRDLATAVANLAYAVGGAGGARLYFHRADSATGGKSGKGGAFYSGGHQIGKHGYAVVSLTHGSSPARRLEASVFVVATRQTARGTWSDDNLAAAMSARDAERVKGFAALAPEEQDDVVKAVVAALDVKRTMRAAAPTAAASSSTPRRPGSRVVPRSFRKAAAAKAKSKPAARAAEAEAEFDFVAVLRPAAAGAAAAKAGARGAERSAEEVLSCGMSLGHGHYAVVKVLWFDAQAPTDAAGDGESAPVRMRVMAYDPDLMEETTLDLRDADLLSTVCLNESVGADGTWPSTAASPQAQLAPTRENRHKLAKRVADALHLLTQPRSAEAPASRCLSLTPASETLWKGAVDLGVQGYCTVAVAATGSTTRPLHLRVVQLFKGGEAAEGDVSATEVKAAFGDAHAVSKALCTAPGVLRMSLRAQQDLGEQVANRVVLLKNLKGAASSSAGARGGAGKKKGAPTAALRPSLRPASQEDEAGEVVFQGGVPVPVDGGKGDKGGKGGDEGGGDSLHCVVTIRWASGPTHGAERLRCTAYDPLTSRQWQVTASDAQLNAKVAVAAGGVTGAAGVAATAKPPAKLPVSDAHRVALARRVAFAVRLQAAGGGKGAEKGGAAGYTLVF